MATIVCAACQRKMNHTKSGVVLVRMAFSPPRPYQLFEADLFECPVCGDGVVSGLADRPFDEHYKPGFDDRMAALIASGRMLVREYEGN